jgi:ribosomal subunit interface protein
MIKLHITSRNFELSDKVLEYTQAKIGGLDRFLPRHMHNQIEGAVLLASDSSGREDNNFVCEASIKVSGPDLQAREATANIYAAIDIVEAKLKAQAVKYKEKHLPQRNRTRKWIARFVKGGEPPVA